MLLLCGGWRGCAPAHAHRLVFARREAIPTKHTCGQDGGESAPIALALKAFAGAPVNSVGDLIDPYVACQKVNFRRYSSVGFEIKVEKIVIRSVMYAYLFAFAE